MCWLCSGHSSSVRLCMFCMKVVMHKVREKNYTIAYELWVDVMLMAELRYDSVYLMCSIKLTGSQLSLPHGINKKLKCETKNKMMSVIGPVQSHYSWLLSVDVVAWAQLVCAVMLAQFSAQCTFLSCVSFNVALWRNLTQGDHLSGKPGNVREFDSCQGSVSEKWPKTVSC